MFSKSPLQQLVLVSAVLLLTACANNEPKPEQPAPPPPVTTAPPAPPPPTVAITPQTPPTVDPSIVVRNPSTVTFETMNVALTDKAKETIAQVASRAKSSKKILITGFCDRNQIRNSTDSAMARAVAVRDELLSYGIEPAVIKLTLNTAVAKKHAAEIKFD